MDRIYITTPLYYVNAEPHLGSAYTMILTDTLARYYRANDYETFYLTGTDEHGDKIAQAAANAGLEPKEFTDQISATFRSVWDECGFAYDHFIRTTDDYHVRYVQEVLGTVYKSGDIYFDRYSGLYCFGCERFYTDKELVNGKCPDHLIEPNLIEEENYFFRMSKYQDHLLRHIETHPQFIRPEGYRNEVLAMLREPVEDLCISRPKSRLTWGIELPFDNLRHKSARLRRLTVWPAWIRGWKKYGRAYSALSEDSEYSYRGAESPTAPAPPPSVHSFRAP